jgi:photosystem II stability/assembly factor-like uncharacterized protein
MSRSFPRLASALILSFIALVGYGSVASGQHAAVSSTRSARTYHTNLMSVSFANANDGWASGGQRTNRGYEAPKGFLFHTTNSGRTWTRTSTHWVAQQMQFIDAATGWAIVESPANCSPGHCSWAVVKTEDGGASWGLQLNGGRCREIESLDFITSQEGSAIESNALCLKGNEKVKTRLMTTSDGGSSWTTALLTHGMRLTSVHFATPLSGWAVADGLSGGNSAQCQTTLFHKSDMSEVWGRQVSFSGYCEPSVDFVDSRFGWIVATNGGACAEMGCIDDAIYRTTDGGNGWTVEKRKWNGAGCGFLGQPHFVSDTVGYIEVGTGGGGCSHGGVDITRDGGHHWVRKSPFGFGIGDISPVSSSNVWAIGCPQHVGECSHLVHTTDEGANWTKIKIG